MYAWFKQVTTRFRPHAFWPSERWKRPNVALPVLHIIKPFLSITQDMELQRREALQKKLAEEAERKKRKKRKINLWLNHTCCLFHLILQLSWVMRNCAYTVCTFPHQINCLSREFASSLIMWEKEKVIILCFNGGHLIVVLLS